MQHGLNNYATCPEGAFQDLLSRDLPVNTLVLAVSDGLWHNGEKEWSQLKETTNCASILITVSEDLGAFNSSLFEDIVCLDQTGISGLSESLIRQIETLEDNLK
jgi:hypothetical protein